MGELNHSSNTWGLLGSVLTPRGTGTGGWRGGARSAENKIGVSHINLCTISPARVLMSSCLKL